MNNTTSYPLFLSRENITLAYRKTPGKNPGVIFCGGFMSDMESAKAIAAENFCREQGHAFIRFDYSGHGQSSGDFAAGNINTWLQDALTIFDQLTEGPQIVIGSSMGGWVGTLLAMARQERVKGLIGVASAPDFTEELIWNRCTTNDKEKLQQEGVIYHRSSNFEMNYPITLQLVENSRPHLILQKEIPLEIPVRLLHSMQDADVPWQYSVKLAEKIRSQNVRLCLLKDGDHRLMRDQDLQLLTNNLTELLSLA